MLFMGKDKIGHPPNTIFPKNTVGLHLNIKIQVLPDMMTLMKSDVQVEEGFRKNRVVCSLATADGNCTLGFSESKKARPKSLIKGNELKNPGTVDLILRKTTGSLFFDEIIVGDTAMLKQFREKIEDIVSAKLFEDVTGE